MNYLSFETIIFKKMYTLKGFQKVFFSNIHSLHLQNKCITKQTFQLISHINCSKRKLMLTCPLSIPRSHAEIDHTLPLSEGISQALISHGICYQNQICHYDIIIIFNCRRPAPRIIMII